MHMHSYANLRCTASSSMLVVLHFQGYVMLRYDKFHFVTLRSFSGY